MSSSDPSTDIKTSESSVITEGKTETETKKPAKKKTGEKSNALSFILLLFIIVLLAAAGGGYYFWQQLQTTLGNLQTENQQQSDHLSELSTKLADTRALAQKQQQNNAQIISQFNEQQKALMLLEKSQQTLVQTTKNVFDISHRDQRQWLLAEVSYLLSIANQRLLISRDIKTATAALKAANNRLHDLADPGLLKLRQTISQEIAQLNLLKVPDLNGIAFSLDNLTPLIAQLPFKTTKQKTLENTQQSEAVELGTLDKSSFFAPLWERIKSLVTVRQHNRDIMQSETPVEKNQIDNQLRYRIETSRLALLDKNTAVFNYEIKSARELISLYYDLHDNRVASLLNELKPLSNINIIPELPDITESWVMLQRVIAINDAQNKTPISDKKNSKGKSIQ